MICYLLAVLFEPRHKKRDTNDIFVKTELLVPPDWYYYEKHSAKILELYLSFSLSYATFLFHANHTFHIGMCNFDWPSRKKIRMSLVSLFS